MTQSTDSEPTLLDIVNRLDKLDSDLKGFSTNLSNDVEKLSNDVEKLSNDVEKLSADGEKFSDRFANYQQATQWVVQLAFTLIASATITIIITAVFKR